MRKHLLGLMLIAGMAGCTSESDVTPAAGKADALVKSRQDLLPTARSLATTRGSHTSFAALPDRGELLAYGGARKVRTAGAYTWHPVSLSEAHALNSIGTGRLVVNTPDGASLALEYQRHEEQPDGNWTWIGRNDDGSSAVLTFGEKAVFGTIARGDTRYRVRTDRTGAWVVETDPRLVAANGGRPADGNDTLLPPESRAMMAAASRQLAKSGASNPAVTEKAVGVIDLLIGYSSTIATELGSQNAAITLMSNLAAMANAAYANSGVSMRLRLVHVMPVNYGDATLNSEALQQLTGSNGTQPITPNAAFSDLRAARNQYGADLVAFVRRYREPEQDGCGIAWLLGAGGQSITAQDEAFGYAVVSDGEDIGSDNNTYFCSDYALAHELGHVMGQTHNRENATTQGVHSYAYGYREGSPTGFFTIMAYPAGDSQVEAPVFANPAVQYAGRPAGTATENNVLSMNHTMPIIASFRARVVPVPGSAESDFNGDGFSDVLWRHATNGQTLAWRSANPYPQIALATIADTNWRIVGTGDFNGDGAADILWRHWISGQNLIWLSGNFNTQVAVQTVPDLNWQVVGVGDFNRDGRSDILWRHATGGQVQAWYSGNSGTHVVLVTVPDANWKVAGVGDFNGDGLSDMLWRSASSGQNAIWLSGNYHTQQAAPAVPDLNWRVAGIGDFNGDGRSDILWRHAGNGQVLVWYSGDPSTVVALVTVPDPNWQVGAVGDFNGDGLSDLLWRHAVDGQNVIWSSGNYYTQQAVVAIPDTNWQVVPRR